VLLLIKWDGHTHTHFCNHGSGEHTEKFIQQAISLGFKQYSLTEHSPLPHKLATSLPYEINYIKALAMNYKQLIEYFKMGQQLKEKYQSQMNILLGLELDYTPIDDGFTQGLLNTYGAYLEDGILSVHHLPGKGGWRCVDYNPDDFKEGLIDYYGSIEQVYKTYYEVVEQCIHANLGSFKPKRIGHLTLIEKFKKVFPLNEPEYCDSQIIEILKLIKQKGYQLDINVSGLYKPDCGDTYPPLWIIKEAIKMNIPLVYGSDSHSVSHVGRSYKIFEKIVMRGR
jgi:histidinol-phosphatase (PHP family)